ncbi:MAG: hypothetical protein HC888_04330 [Candidatus Competibacteraceae bacterium]|nr:hypothetical protein [Candidatus Competibacteraceae bacterium]
MAEGQAKNPVQQGIFGAKGLGLFAMANQVLIDLKAIKLLLQADVYQSKAISGLCRDVEPSAYQIMVRLRQVI